MTFHNPRPIRRDAPVAEPSVVAAERPRRRESGIEFRCVAAVESAPGREERPEAPLLEEARRLLASRGDIAEMTVADLMASLALVAGVVPPDAASVNRPRTFADALTLARRLHARNDLGESMRVVVRLILEAATRSPSLIDPRRSSTALPQAEESSETLPLANEPTEDPADQVSRTIRVVPSPGARIEIGPEAVYFSYNGGERVELRNRSSARRLLVALIEAHEREPGSTTSSTDLIELVWPGEKMTLESGRARLYMAICQLRKLGLREALLSWTEGYGLSRQLAIVRRAL